MKRAAADLTVADVAKAIGVATSAWSGNCYAIACAILRAKLVKGRPAYGHWTGPVSKKSPFASRRGLPIVRHGWIILENGAVMDPTRWVFEAVEPYIYVGMQVDDGDCTECGYKEYEHDEDDVLSPTCSGYSAPEWPYDEGGDRMRTALQRPFPEVGVGEAVCVRLKLVAAIRKRLAIPVSMTRQQAAWVANLPYRTLGRDAWAVCVALEAAGCKAYVPIDTWTRADAERGL